MKFDASTGLNMNAQPALMMMTEPNDGFGKISIKGGPAVFRARPVIFIFAFFLVLLLSPPGIEAESARPESKKNKGASEQIFRAIYPNAPKTLDPHADYDPAAWPIIMAAYDRLMTLKNGTAEPAPSLVEAVRISSDGRQYTFVLRPNFTFADGVPLNSEAVLYSFDRLMSTEVGNRYFPYLKKFEIIGPYSFRLILDRPWPPFLASLALPPASLVSPGLAKKPAGYLGTQSLGSGRYQVYDWRDGTIGLKARTDLLSLPKLNLIMFHYETDALKRYEKTLAYSAHLTIDPFFPQGEMPPQYQIKSVPGFETRYLAINTRRPYVKSQSVRRAIGLIISEAFKDHPGHFDGFFPAGLFYNAPPSVAEGLPDDALAQAMAMLKNVARPKGPLRLIHRSSDSRAPAEAALIAEVLSAAGLKMQIKAVEGENLGRILNSGDYDFFLDTRTTDIPSPDMWLGRFLDSTSTVDGNPAHFSNARVDGLIDEIVNSIGQAGDGPADLARIKKEQALKISDLAEIASVEVPYVFLYSLEKRLMIDVRLAGIVPHPQWPEVWPLDQVDLKPFSFRSGANPTGRPPERNGGADSETTVKSQGIPQTAHPNSPSRTETKAPKVTIKNPETPKVTIPASPTEPVNPVAGVPAPVIKAGSSEGPRLKLLEDGDFNAQSGPPNPEPGYDDFIGTEMD